MPQNVPKGRIVKRSGDRYIVFHNDQDITCAVRQKVTKSDMYPAVGDWVEITLIDDDNGVIERIIDRGPSLTRTAAGPKPRPQVLLANLDVLVIVTSVTDPDPNTRLIDRFLVMAEFAEIPTIIVWNKIDLLSKYRIPESIIYKKIGYPIVYTCAISGKGTKNLKQHVTGKTSMFIGASGVGKTSILNQLTPGLGQKVAEISQATGKGKHATSATEIFPLDGNTYIADSPGVREFALWGVAPIDLGRCFREFQLFAEQCRFGDCLHDQEIDCAVKDAVHRGDIEWERWDSYIRILQTL